mmetsp:Transcript_61077/g.175979  ORF Transcript_61077/g.175979 Transcript_61077/m.175979 type:complete len:293 (-) Transcript_61077:183-1061(-)
MGQLAACGGEYLLKDDRPPCVKKHRGRRQHCEDHHAEREHAPMAEHKEAQARRQIELLRLLVTRRHHPQLGLLVPLASTGLMHGRKHLVRSRRPPGGEKEPRRLERSYHDRCEDAETTTADKPKAPPIIVRGGSAEDDRPPAHGPARAVESDELAPVQRRQELHIPYAHRRHGQGPERRLQSPVDDQHTHGGGCAGHEHMQGRCRQGAGHGHGSTAAVVHDHRGADSAQAAAELKGGGQSRHVGVARAQLRLQAGKGVGCGVLRGGEDGPSGDHARDVPCEKQPEWGAVQRV